MNWRLGNMLPHAASWIVAGGLGWLVYLQGTALTTDGRMIQLLMGLGVVVALATGIVASQLLERRVSLSDAEHQLMMAGASWGVAAFAGWNIGVMVGGPTSGVVTFMALNALFVRQPWRQAALVVLAVVAGRLAMEIPGGADLMPGVFWCAISVAVATSAAVMLLDRSPFKKLFPLAVIWWGSAWVFSFWAKNNTGIPSLAGYGPNSAEVIFAFTIGAAVTGKALFSPHRMLCWFAGGVFGSLVGLIFDVLLTTALMGSDALFTGTTHYLDAGQVVGMGAGAMMAMMLTRD